MTESSVVEIIVQAEECYPVQPNEERNNLIVRHPFTTDFTPDLLEADPPSPQHLTLALWEVLVDNDHAGASSTAYSQA